MEVIFKGFIEDVRNEKCNEKCSDVQIVVLSQIFMQAVLPFAKVSAGKPWYTNAQYDNLVGFEEAKEANVEEFSLIITKTDSDKKFDHFSGKFVCDGKNLKILAKIRKI